MPDHSEDFVTEALATATTATIRWSLRAVALKGTCDGCSEHRPLPYVEEETEAYLCHRCWLDAITDDRLALALYRACADGWADGEGAMVSYLRDAQAEIERSLSGNSEEADRGCSKEPR